MRRPARISVLLAVLALLGASVVVAAGVGGSTKRDPQILRQARSLDGPAYRFARDHHARISPTPDGRSYYALWPDRRPTGPVIVTLHGFKSYAFDQFRRWYPHAKAHGYSILALQWRLTRTGSYSPQEIYGQAARILDHEQVPSGRALLHGFSSAAIRTYGITALDRAGQRFFGMTIADAGGAFPSFPINRRLIAGQLGRQALRGSHFVLFCGGRDPHPDYTGCPAMREAGTLIRRRGGRVERLIRDPRAGHAGFHEHPQNVENALSVFGRLEAP